jgi:2-C-methyl-D-erythritol 4-phosphate cytidylyltransferase
MLEFSARLLLEQAWIDQVFVVVAADDPYQESIFKTLALSYGGRVQFVAGAGATRRDTVLAGLIALQASRAGPQANAMDVVRGGTLAQPWVMVHDAARPGLERADLEKLREMVLTDTLGSGGLLALPLTDTVKRIDSTGQHGSPRSLETLDRSTLWAAQTPQMFRLEDLIQALKHCKDVTDEASAIEQLGGRPLLVEGSAQNFKVTTPGDLVLMRGFLKARHDAGEAC